MSKITSIAGLKFEIVTPYAEGHPLNEAEANVLNQVYAENIGNNLRAKIKEQIDGTTEKAGGELSEDQTAKLTTAIQEQIVAPYNESYKLEAKKPAAPRVTDPVEKEARKLGTDALIKALATQLKCTNPQARKILKGEDVEGVQVRPGTAEALQQRLEDIIAKGGKIWKVAEANVKKSREATAGVLDGILDAAE